MINSFYNFRHALQYSFIILMLYSFHLIGTQNVQETLNAIPNCEKEALEKLFHSLFNGEHFSYTLFGDKPMSLTSYSTSVFNTDDFLSLSELKFRKRWRIWKKYEHLFSMTRYFLVEGPSDKHGRRDIYFINKKYFIEKVNEHLDLFQEALGENITGALLLNKIENNQKYLSFFDDHPMLLGILLGYGEHNARLYAKRDKLSPFVYREEIPKIPIKIPNPSKGFSSLQEEFNSYFSVLTLFGDTKYFPLIIHSVHFVADHNHPETRVLQKKYKKMRGEISAIYAKGNFLEITLSKLAED